MEGGELWLDKILGGSDIEVYYRPDGYACWFKWHAFQKCAAKDCREDPTAPCADSGYPVEAYCEQDAIPISLKKPVYPPCVEGVGRPANLGYQFQVKIVVNGWARIRGLVLYALWREKRPYEGLACQTLSTRL